MKTCMFLMMLMLFSVNVYCQTSYYVDGVNGNNTNAGTSLAGAWKTIQKAAGSATPGSTVYIKGGTYKENVTVNVSGTAGSPITFRNYENDSVYLDGTGTTGTTLLTVRDKSYLVFQNITIQNLTKNNAKGILVECTSTGQVTSLLFRKLVIRNIRWNSNPNTLPDENKNAQAFIAYGRGTSEARAITDLVIDSSEVYSNILGYSEAVSLDGNINGFSIRDNVVHDNTNIAIYVGGNYGECTVPSLDHTRNGVIERNKCYKNIAFYATSSGVYADGAHSVIIRNNITYRNGYGIEVGCEENGTTENITVIDNVIYKNQEGGLAVGGYDTGTSGQVLNSVFRNNTFFQNDSLKHGSGEIYITKASGCTFRNNILYANSQRVLFALETISPQANNTFNYNAYYTPQNNAGNIVIYWRSKTYTTFSGYKSGTAQDANSFYGNPNLVNTALTNPDLHLQTGSPAIDAGDPATVLVGGETDFGGNPRVVNGRIDIGAYEFDGSGILKTEEHAGNREVSVYPNPSLQSVAIAMPGMEIRSLSIQNAGGELLLEQQVGEESIVVDISTLPSGVYFIRLVHKDGVEVRKLVKR